MPRRMLLIASRQSTGIPEQVDMSSGLMNSQRRGQFSGNAVAAVGHRGARSSGDGSSPGRGYRIGSKPSRDRARRRRHGPRATDSRQVPVHPAAGRQLCVSLRQQRRRGQPRPGIGQPVRGTRHAGPGTRPPAVSTVSNWIAGQAGPRDPSTSPTGMDDGISVVNLVTIMSSRGSRRCMVRRAARWAARRVRSLVRPGGHREPPVLAQRLKKLSAIRRLHWYVTSRRSRRST